MVISPKKEKSSLNLALRNSSCSPKLKLEYVVSEKTDSKLMCPYAFNLALIFCECKLLEKTTRKKHQITGLISCFSIPYLICFILEMVHFCLNYDRVLVATRFEIASLSSSSSQGFSINLSNKLSFSSSLICVEFA